MHVESIRETTNPNFWQEERIPKFLNLEKN
jgi:hypothetical protein